MISTRRPLRISLGGGADLPSYFDRLLTLINSSGTIALLKALDTYTKNLVHPRDRAEQAYHTELDLLCEPISKQDQYIAADVLRRR